LHRVRRSAILVDEDGVGRGVVDHLECRGFVGNATPFKAEQAELTSEYVVNYQKLRSQCSYTLADYTERGVLAVATGSEEFKQFITEELEQIKAKDVDKDVKRRIISKDEIKEPQGRSPDFADRLMMRMYFEVQKQPEPGVRLL